MSGPVVRDVAAVILAARGGARLERALASVAWAGERLVVDVAGRVPLHALPPGVVRLTNVADVPDRTRAPWLFLVAEEEAASPAVAAAVAEALAPGNPGIRGRDAYRVPREVRGFGAAVAPGGAPVRLARRAGAVIGVRAGLAPALVVPGRRAGRLRAALVADVGDSLATAVEDLEADATALAGVLRTCNRAPLLRAATVAMVLAGGRVLCGRRRPTPARPQVWARWTLAVLAGYRAMVAYAKLWEGLQLEAAALR